jgi:cytoskeletal protein RodZ
MRSAENNSGSKDYGPYEFALGDELRGERATLGKTLLDVQRDLRIKAAYIAAIEDAQTDAFPNPSFVAGYVRSYARYLGLDPNEVFHRFCEESGFVGAAKASAGSRPAKGVAAVPGAGGFRPDFPMAKVSGGMPAIPLPAVGSLLVLLLLVAGLGYGGWTVLENIQRVQFAPVDDLPLAVAEVETLEEPQVAVLDEPALTELSSPVAATDLADLYRQQELEVPILVPRDGPIAALDPDRIGLLAGHRGVPETTPATAAARPRGPLEAADSAGAAEEAASPAVAAPEAQSVVVVTERAAWVRVYLGNGTIIF